MINVDEAGFGKSAKENYSWLQAGKTARIRNNVFAGRVNLILRVSQFGYYLGFITAKSIWTTDYCLYLKVLARVLKSWGFDTWGDAVVIQDKCEYTPYEII